MKKDIHPKYFPKTKVKCACGHNFTIGSTKKHIETEICSKCHPFYTGKEKIIDTLGRVEKFKKRLSKKLTTTKKRKTKNRKNSKPQLKTQNHNSKLKTTI